MWIIACTRTTHWPLSIQASSAGQQGLTAPLEIWGLPTVGTRPAGGLPPLHASKYNRCAAPSCRSAGRGEGLSPWGIPGGLSNPSGQPSLHTWNSSRLPHVFSSMARPISHAGIDMALDLMTLSNEETSCRASLHTPLHFPSMRQSHARLPLCRRPALTLSVYLCIRFDFHHSS